MSDPKRRGPLTRWWRRYSFHSSGKRNTPCHNPTQPKTALCQGEMSMESNMMPVWACMHLVLGLSWFVCTGSQSTNVVAYGMVRSAVKTIQTRTHVGSFRHSLPRFSLSTLVLYWFAKLNMLNPDANRSTSSETGPSKHLETCRDLVWYVYIYIYIWCMIRNYIDLYTVCNHVSVSDCIGIVSFEILSNFQQHDRPVQAAKNMKSIATSAT